jgi:hypothetical protein
VSADMSQVIIPKSDQINADDFLAGPKTYVIESVAISPGTEQPVSIRLAGERKVWRPCKSMCRVMVAAWGPDAKAYAGRSVTLYRDPTVKWAGLEIGGIRISHMSHIERDMLLQLTATKGKRAPHVVRPLAATPRQADPSATLTNEQAAEITRLAMAAGVKVGTITDYYEAQLGGGIVALQQIPAAEYARIVRSIENRLPAEGEAE